MDLRAFIFDHIQPIEDGKTVTLTCPVCGTAGKFTATVKDDYVLYNCYRNSCSTRGKFSLQLSSDETIKAIKRRKLQTNYEDDRRFIVPDYWIDGLGDDRCLKYLDSMHMRQAYESGLFRPMYDPAEQRFIFPIKNDEGKIEGAIGRTLIGAAPKVHNYNKVFDRPFICGDKNSILIVEDCASAVAATRGGHYSAMALLGTSIRKDFIKYLSPYQWVGIALDKDAYSSSIILRGVLTTYLKNVTIRKLSKDIKDMNDDEYEKWWVDNG